ncbi:V-type proton ATPase subunit D-like [Aricia agestis]|uniref:V-type proton ATPase subunit D-like n=1 Tax=Aricia agestis TaxID=91739 RepID=UPI001C204E4C|nr:V-type proton ATPase subunit D-like [Aricia agestis]
MNLENRYSVSASLFMLNEIKNRHQNVRKAHQLLKRQADALRSRLRQVALELCATQALVSHAMKEAYIALAAVKFTNGESNAFILENVAKAQVRVQRTQENIAGVPTMSLRAVEVPYVGDVLKYSGLAAGGHRTSEAKKSFRNAVTVLLKFATLRSTCGILNNALQSTQRKVNGIEKVIMPKLLNTEIYITKELDEREREEFYRLKMVKAKKRIIKLSELRNRQKGLYSSEKTLSTSVSVISETSIFINLW